ncbi:MAG: transcription-repair coupling factor [Christensenellales bacterium]
MKNPLFEALLAAPNWQTALAGCRKPGCTALYDVTESQRLFLSAAASQQLDRPVLFVTPTEQAALRAAEDASALLQGRAALLPAPDMQFLRAVSGRETSWQRLNVLQRARRGEIDLLCVSAETLMHRFMPPADLEGFTLQEGQQVDPQAIIRRLTDSGYERVEMVEGKGQCAMRGDIIDLFAPDQDEADRVEFFDTQVDSIRSFDIVTQRSRQRLKRLDICPALEYFVRGDDRQDAARRMQAAVREALQQQPGGSHPSVRAEETGDEPEGSGFSVGLNRLLRDAEELEETGSFPAIHLWSGIVLRESCSLVDLLKDPLIVIDTPERAVGRLHDRAQGFAEDLDLALGRGEAVPRQQTLLFGADEILERLRRQPILGLMELLRGMGGLEPDLVLPLKGQGLGRYQGRFAELGHDIRGWMKEGWSIALLCSGDARAERLQHALAEFGCPVTFSGELRAPTRGVPLLMKLPFSHGFLIEEARLVLLTDTDVFGSGQKKTRARASAGEKIEAFTDLTVGDYVVHEHHGVGIYQGTVRLQSEGAWRDYLFIQYRASDKLYVPLDQFDRVQKYIGAGDAAPALSDLGSGEWDKQKKKVKSGLQKLAFDLLALYAQRQSQDGFAFPAQKAFESQFDDNFEYELTPDQQQAVRDVLRDMEKPITMDRLLCGDVGYGKTEVAMRAAFRAVINSKQVAFLAPTTILVQQHWRTLTRRFEGFPLRIGYVSRFRSPKENKETLQQVQRGEIDILVGTHRLLSKDVRFRDLGLLVVDEEQRFGVSHKESIKNLKKTVDVLTLSATPIPRTLHMSMVGVRDLSLLETPPEERYPVQTYVVDYSEGLMRDAIMREIDRDGQVFFLYNRVADIDRMASRLRQLVPEASIAIAHGQMQEGALEDVMMDFYAGRYQVLLCTTIIENGIDIPRANTLIVYDADHFGLSQLYQLRGRVGRSNRAAYAYFTVRPDKSLSETAEKRLAAIKEFTEFGAGFRIAMRDLSIRGAGNILGPEQSGQVSAIGYDLYCKLIEEAVREAKGDFSGQRESEMDTRVDLHVNAYLPESYVPGEAQRMEIYKRISMIKSKADRDEMLSDLVDRFGEPEDAVINLVDVALLRALAGLLGAEFVTYQNEALKLRLNPKFVQDPALLYKGLVATDRRLTLQAGKKPSILLLLPRCDELRALKEGVKVLTKLVKMSVLPETQKEAVKQGV